MIDLAVQLAPQLMIKTEHAEHIVRPYRVMHHIFALHLIEAVKENA